MGGEAVLRLRFFIVSVILAEGAKTRELNEWWAAKYREKEGGVGRAVVQPAAFS